MVTMKMVAEALGLSRTAVSLALNDRYDGAAIPVSTRERIKAKAVEMGFRVNKAAKSITSGSTNLIAYVEAAMTTEYSAKMLNVVSQVSLEQGYLTQIFAYWKNEAFADYARELIEQRPAGVICRSIGSEQLTILRRECAPFHIPIVIIDSAPGKGRGIWILEDGEDGGYQATTHLLKLGHRNVLHFTHAGDKLYVQARRRGYERAMTEAGLVGRVVVLDNDQDNALASTLVESPWATAVFCVSDLLAMKVIQEAAKLNWSVPDQLSVVGYADLSAAAYSLPPLTTVQQPFEALGLAAVSELLKEIDKKKKPKFLPNRQHIAPVTLILRDSTAKT